MTREEMIEELDAITDYIGDVRALRKIDGIIAAPTPPADPPGLMALVQRLQQAHVRVETVPDGDFAGADIADREFSDAEEALLAWTPAAPPETPVEPQCAGPFVDAFDCPKCDPRKRIELPTRPETVTRAQLASIINYIDILENSQDGYYRASESDEANTWRNIIAGLGLTVGQEGGQ